MSLNNTFSLSLWQMKICFGFFSKRKVEMCLDIEIAHQPCLYSFPAVQYALLSGTSKPRSISPRFTRDWLQSDHFTPSLFHRLAKCIQKEEPCIQQCSMIQKISKPKRSNIRDDRIFRFYLIFDHELVAIKHLENSTNQLRVHLKFKIQKLYQCMHQYRYVIFHSTTIC